ncbi:PH domain-containing protein [Corynebacterium sp. P7003]|uniref:PH domain-containing protein n=1 Tax=Corynebacterium pygosceleis TaxID=2800406 RepID=A0ABT3WS08_9CORY|nr:PH domain-containing protein [Corynebacterium pygosceleis]MCX7444853.1 PH domain-containing protein [Corynebacterium pygosceleis]
MSGGAENDVRDTVGPAGPDGDYRRVHRISPLLHFWTVLLALVAVAVGNMWGEALGAARGLVAGEIHLDAGPLLIGAGGFIVVCTLIWLISGVWWRAAGYRLTAEEVVHRQGVLGVRVRTARYDRIQAVDIVESVIARIFGLAEVRIETAGGDDSAIGISYLSRGDAGRLRAEILDLTGERNRVPGAPAGVSGGGAPDAGSDPEVSGGEVVVTPVPVARSLTAALLSGWLLLLVPALAAVLIRPEALGMLWPLFIGVVPATWNIIDNSWRFTVRRDGGKLDIAYGLADRRRQTLKLSRVHSVEIRQRLLWRITGWWSVRVCVAGYGDAADGGTTILPVGTREEAVRVAALLSPLTAPEIEGVARPEGWTEPRLRSPRRARWLSPLAWRQQSVTFAGGPDDGGGGLPEVIILHGGRFTRRMSMVALPHIQEISLSTGVVGRALDLGSVQLHLVDGPVRMVAAELGTGDAVELLELLRRRRLPALVPVDEAEAGTPE